MNTKELALKHGALEHIISVGYSTYEFTLNDLESLLAEHLVLSSSEPIYQVQIIDGWQDCGKEWYEQERYSDNKRIVYLANPINQQLLDSHKRLEEALLCLLPGLILDRRYADLIDDDLDAMQSRIDTVQEALSSIPEQVRNINESKDENQ